jgi:hypothetical protein
MTNHEVQQVYFPKNSAMLSSEQSSENCNSGGKSSRSFCAGRTLFHLARKAFLNALAEVLQSLAENVAGFLSARRCE